jgi:hypothetical protein
VNKALQPILSRLTALSTPAQVAPGGARVIADMTHPNPLAALLRELNETILARALRLDSSDGSSLTLDVAGRRVLRLSEASGVTGAERCLAAGTLEDDYKDDLLKLLQAVAAPRHELRVTSRPLPNPSEGLSVGLPVALLADLLLIELNDAPLAQLAEPAQPPRRSARVIALTPEAPAPAPAPEAPSAPEVLDLERFSATVGPALIAWVIQGGAHDGGSGGPEEMLSPLQTFLADEAEAVVTQLDRAATLPGGPICLVLGASLVEGHSVICARSGDGLLLGVVEGDATQRLLRAWAGARG